jgi:hypothetical protein
MKEVPSIEVRMRSDFHQTIPLSARSSCKLRPDHGLMAVLQREPGYRGYLSVLCGFTTRHR